jgi:hypothetical protein
VIDIGEKNKLLKSLPASSPTFISVAQLINVVYSLSLNLSQQEIEVLASGFASDGEGGIDCREFCDMIHTLVYNLLGDHAREVHASQALTRVGKHSAGYPAEQPQSTLGSQRFASKESTKSGRREKAREDRDSTVGEPQQVNNERNRLLLELADGIVRFDK